MGPESRRNIRQCSLFVAIISRNTLTCEKRYFRVEWNYAIEIERMTPPGEAFLLPIVIDATPMTEENLPARFHEIQSLSAAGGEASARFRLPESSRSIASINWLCRQGRHERDAVQNTRHATGRLMRSAKSVARPAAV